MKTLQISIIATLIVCVIFLIIPHNAYASTCAYRETIYSAPQFFLLSDNVFVGTVTSINNYSDHQWQVHFNIEKIWKGVASRQSSTVMAYTLQACGYSITVGEKYLIYTNGSPSFINTVWTRTYADAQNDIALFDDPKFQSEEKAKSELNKKLDAAKGRVESMMMDKTSHMPINGVGVDQVNSTLDINIDNTKTSLSAKEYQKRLTEILGDIPIKIEFGQFTALAPLIETNPINLGPPPSISPMIEAPLKQFKSGISANNVICKEGLQLVIKSEDGSPACVKPETAQKLVERGWGTIEIPMISQNKIYSNYTSTVPVTNHTITTILIPFDSYNAGSNRNFTPANVTVIIGFNNTVQWTNADEVVHTVVSDYSRFNSGLILPNQTWTFVFEKPGTYPYHGEPGSWLRGVVIASSPSQPIPQALPNGTGIVVLTEGQEFGPFLVQTITPDSVSGLNFIEYPVATNKGFPITLHIGDSVSNGCTQILTLEKITEKTATFLMKGSGGSSHNCPICLSGNTFIDTPKDPINVKELKIGMQVWTLDNLGHKQTATILKTGKTLVPSNHVMIHILLNDGRELFASPGHPTADGRLLEDLKQGDSLDNSHVKSVERVPYNENYTYDILPSGSTAFYWANGILVGSTLK